MTHAAEHFGEQVEGRLEALKTNAFSVEKAAGLPPDAIRNIIRSQKKAGPTLSRVQEVCDALGLELYIGPPRETAPASDQIAADDFVEIQRFDLRLSAGPGSSGDNARPLAPVAFRLDWMRTMGLRADACVVVGIGGDSMQPALHAGDLVLVDRRQAPLRPGAIYAVVDVSGDTVVKRIEPVAGGLILRSDNPDHPSMLRTGDDAARTRIIGRVVWSGHVIADPAAHGPRATRKTFDHTWF